MSTKGIGASLLYDGTNTLADVYSLTPAEPEIGEINTTTYDITDNAHQYESGLIEGGEVEFGVIYGESQYATLYDLQGTETEWEIQFADGASQSFTGFITSIGTEHPDADDDEVLRNTVTIKISGKPDFTAS